MKKYLITLLAIFTAISGIASFEEDVEKFNSILKADWEKHKLTEVPAASDYVFLRRAMLDTRGVLPAPWEIKKFVALIYRK